MDAKYDVGDLVIGVKNIGAFVGRVRTVHRSADSVEYDINYDYCFDPGKGPESLSKSSGSRRDFDQSNVFEPEASASAIKRLVELEEEMTEVKERLFTLGRKDIDSGKRECG